MILWLNLQLMFRLSDKCKKNTCFYLQLNISIYRVSLVAQMVKNPPVMQETWVQSLGQEDPPEKWMATHSSIMAWRIPWTEEPGELQFMGLQRVRHDWTTNKHTQMSIYTFFPKNLCEWKFELEIFLKNTSYCFSSVIKSCPTLCDPTDLSIPGLPVHH